MEGSAGLPWDKGDRRFRIRATPATIRTTGRIAFHENHDSECNERIPALRRNQKMPAAMSRTPIARYPPFLVLPEGTGEGAAGSGDGMRIMARK
jgi:hypothetical protein